MSLRRRATTGIRRLLDLALIVLFAVSIFSIVLARGVPLTGRSTFVVAGGSMVPAIPLGAAVVTEPVAPSDLVVGDIVSLRSGPDRAIFTHRISRIAVQDGQVWIETRGDANATIDPSITPVSSVLGRVRFIIPLAGFVIAWLALPSGIVAVMATGLACMTASWLLAGGGRRANPAPTIAPPSRGLAHDPGR